MSEWWAVTARRPLEFMPRILCVFDAEAEARAEHDRLVAQEKETAALARSRRVNRMAWKFGLAGYVEHPVPEKELAPLRRKRPRKAAPRRRR